MSIDNLFFLYQSSITVVCASTQSISLVVHLSIFFFFCERNLYSAKSFEFYHFFLYLCPVSSKYGNVKTSMVFLVMDDMVETIGQF